MGGGIFLIGITLVGGAYIASRWIARWWERFIAFGESRYREVYGDDPYIVELFGNREAPADYVAGAATRQGPPNRCHIAHDRDAK